MNPERRKQLINFAEARRLAGLSRYRSNPSPLDLANDLALAGLTRLNKSMVYVLGKERRREAVATTKYMQVFTVDKLLQKAKYTKRWKGPDGKWRYEYPEDLAPKQSEIKIPKNFVSPIVQAKALQRALAKLNPNLEVDVDKAKTTKSTYMTIYQFGTGETEPIGEWEIRISDHPPKLGFRGTSPYYDFEIGSYVDADATHWRQIISVLQNKIIANKTNQKPEAKKSLGLKERGQKIAPMLPEEEMERVAKSMCVYTADELLLQKADARGGTYYKRVPGKGTRKWRYFYKPEDYDSRDDTHTGGGDNERSYLSASVSKCIKAAGPKGCGPESLKSLVKKYGAKKVGETLRQSVKGGTLAFKKGKFSAVKPRGDHEADSEQRQPSKRRAGAGRQLGSDARSGQSRKDRKGRTRPTRR